MTQKQKGQVGLVVMLVLAAVTALGSDQIYRMIDNIGKEALGFTAGTYTGVAQGFGGDVIATVTVSDKRIETVNLEGKSETPGIGDQALNQLPAVMIEQQSAEVDIVAGATVTSNAVIQAVRSALDQAAGVVPAESAAEVPESAAVEPTAAEESVEAETESEEVVAADHYEVGSYTTIAAGYGGDIIADVTIDDDGRIESVELRGAAETPAIGQAALEKLAPLFVKRQSAEVDLIAGATVTSAAAVKAVREALDEARAEGRSEADEAVLITGTSEADAAVSGEDSGVRKMAPGNFEASQKGFAGEIIAAIVVDQSGTLKQVTLTGDAETPAIGQAALKELEKALMEKQPDEIDEISGATITYEAAIKAFDQAVLYAQEAFEEQ